MITFTKVRWKNFLSTGNTFTEILLNKSTTTLILGENGSGKSTLLDALCFGLFGKAFRKINKPQLLNSINQKNCIVEIEFISGKKNYRISRGIKPAIFNIFCNDELVNQDADSKDYQKVLEEQILKFNYKAFTQIGILGSASFTPFMQLSPAHRREVIEDILDIQIFSKMNILLKDKIFEVKEFIRQIDSKIELEKQKAKMQKDFIKKIEDSRDKKNLEVKAEIDKTMQEMEDAQKIVTYLIDQIQIKTSKTNKKDDLNNKLLQLTSMKQKLDSCNAKLSADITFYSNNDQCPACKQSITLDYKNNILGSKKTKFSEVEEAIKTLNKDMDKLNKNIQKISDITTEIKELSKQLQEQNSIITSGEKYLVKLKKQEEEPSDTIIENLNNEKLKLKEIAKEVIRLSNDKSDFNQHLEYLTVCSMMLKDTGIKTKVIKQYLPIINKMVNKFLTAMDFFVHMELDESFNEVMKSRHRDEFSYASFSEGEKQRIDLALLFTWRVIAKMKNSVNTNLLILDEIFDSSLDNNGTDYLMALLNTLGEETNLFVISHKGDVLFDKFRSVIRYEKQNNFSILR
jgi:DNA repair exonuclease SbcCD ATPase subunit